MNTLSVIKAVLTRTRLFLTMFVLWVALSASISWGRIQSFGDLKRILTGSTAIVGSTLSVTRAGWVQVNVRISNLTLSPIEIQGVATNCRVNLAESLPRQVPPLSNDVFPIFVELAGLGNEQPIIIFLDGVQHTITVRIPKPDIRSAPNIDTTQLPSDQTLPSKMSSILESP